MSLPLRPLALLASGALAVTAAALAAPAPAQADAGTGAALTTASTTADGARLSWAPPALVSPTTVQVTDAKHDLKLDKTKDYVVRMPATPLVSATGLTIYGGHHVVLIGGEIRTSGRGLYLNSQTGTVHVEGLRISGADATEGIDVAAPHGATVQLEDVAVETVHGSRSTNHADVLQSWAGPGVLRVDRLEGSTTYQGFFLAPAQYGTLPDSVDVRHTVLRCAVAVCGYLLWQSGSFPITTSDTTVVSGDKPFPGQVLMAPSGSTSWSAVRKGGADTPSPLLGTPGVGYTSPGYADGAAPAPAPSAAPVAGGTTTTTATTALLGAVGVTRHGGADRYATAAALSASTFPGGAADVVVASGADFPDALAAGQLAGARRAPLLLVPRDGAVPAVVADELTRLHPARITVVGGAGSVSDGVLAQLQQHAATTRIDGADRYATAAAVAAASGTPGRTVLLASGLTFPDAIGGGALAASEGGTLLLTRPGDLPPVTAAALTALAPARVVLLGGTGSVSDAVRAAVTAAAPGAAVERWAGPDRYATASAVGTTGHPGGARTVVLAAGTTFPDALAGGPAAGLADAPVLLVQPTCVPAATLTALAALRPTSLVLLGSTGAVAPAVADLRPC